jgi:hypothetical protein
MRKSDFIECNIKTNGVKETSYLIPICNVEYLECCNENVYKVILKPECNFHFNKYELKTTIRQD